ncbi:hypothetical protein L1F30_13880 [Simiduia sp. 21SJ11W-1]|uniref:hypothetical protein n=1 Tax=Simiduia sp. 21SJ11W-1 TaxID=2909669 RepID=UPI00209D9FA7|nr:hypothetical protein [Simiduia sp. 21SJ11W-1]UTA47246.1 hypothetical protein L1F30_13880 [Simiduia sp. 21SJ11W-1]
MGAATRNLFIDKPVSGLIGGLFFGLCVLAEPALAGRAGWSQAALVHSLEPTAQRRYVLRVHLDEAHSCKSGHSYFQDYSANGAGFIFDTLLMAMAQELPVQVHTSGRCELNGYAEITAVRIAR